ncbi:AGC/AKT protein kinase [Gigaspora margarita]|uniref:non-specific serine/threonine protein kinase n=2 Tax=Gigaspora margarita TaxID=4874 RepID=A0A8H4ER15_GIGMA|nr:AGC/AKT protein kinase [Gigaspora margarita]
MMNKLWQPSHKQYGKESSAVGADGNNGRYSPSTPTSPTPILASGVLVIRVVEARGLTLPPGIRPPQVPPHYVPSAPTSTRGNRDSMQRKQCWWLPYVVLEFDKNEVLIDALGGEVQNPTWQYKAHFDVSRESDVSIQIYLRKSTQTGQHTNDMGNDVFLGGVKFVPSFIEPNKLHEQWYKLQGGSGDVHVHVCYKKDHANVPLTIDAFDLLKVIGKGSFGKVMQVRKRDTSRIYALKTIRKAHIVSRSEVNHTLAERTVLAQINNPFIVPLKFSFQSTEKLYLVLAFVNGGELFHHLQREGRFDEERSRFYAAELLCALECLHDFNVVYRDLKPENILLDYSGHIALCDFGLCKLNMTESETTNTFCGTPEYLSPELLLGQGYTKTIDWWTLGVLLYEMLTGLPPFYDENTNEMYRKILQDELRFPDEVSSEARSLLTGLLTRDPNHRLGNNGAQEIKEHAFFSAIDWKKLILKKVQPPFKPSVESAIDTSNFDEEFTSETPKDSLVNDSHLSETIQRQFDGFTFNPNDGIMSGSMANSVDI